MRKGFFSIRSSFIDQWFMQIYYTTKYEIRVDRCPLVLVITHFIICWFEPFIAGVFIHFKAHSDRELVGNYYLFPFHLSLPWCTHSDKEKSEEVVCPPLFIKNFWFIIINKHRKSSWNFYDSVRRRLLIGNLAYVTKNVFHLIIY